MAPRKEPRASSLSSSPPAAAGPAERSALAALQTELDEERIAHAGTRAQLAGQVGALEERIAELEAELASAAARLRELDARLQARGR